MHDAVQDVIRQVSPTTNFRTASWNAHSEPCLQVADYCCWALSRKWEKGDDRSYALIQHKIRSEFRRVPVRQEAVLLRRDGTKAARLTSRPEGWQSPGALVVSRIRKSLLGDDKANARYTPRQALFDLR